MAITINGTTVTRITLNNTALSSVTLNGTAIFPGSAVETMRDYVFPNESKYCYRANNITYTYGLGIGVTGAWAANQGYLAMDNKTNTYWANKTSNSDNTERFTVTLPFNVKVNSVTISNASTRNTGMTYGYIFVSTSTSEEDWQTLATFQGRSGNAGVSTTYDCPSSLAPLTTIRRVRVAGTAWASLEEHSVGEITLSFKAQTSDLQAYGLL